MVGRFANAQGYSKQAAVCMQGAMRRTVGIGHLQSMLQITIHWHIRTCMSGEPGTRLNMFKKSCSVQGRDLNTLVK